MNWGCGAACLGTALFWICVLAFSPNWVRYATVLVAGGLMVFGLVFAYVDEVRAARRARRS